MAVLCEAYSVLVRLESVDRYFPGGQDAFTNLVTNNTFCSDGSLARVGFMTPGDVEQFVGILEAHGLQFVLHRGSFSVGIHGRPETDIVVVSQLHGPTTACSWIDCFRMQITAGCWVVGARLLIDGVPQADPDGGVDLHTPAGWKYDHSISASRQFVSFEDMPGRMKFLREGGGVDIYLDTETGKEMFVGRA
jgi:hypothetical protein